MARPVHFSEDPKQLIKHHSRVTQARSGPLSEARTYLQMFHSRPSTLTQGNAAVHIVDVKGLREIGFNTLAEAVGGATSQIAKPLTAVVTPIAGTWETKQACESFGQLLNGILEAQDFLSLSRAMTVEAALVPESHAIWEADPVTKDFRCVRLDPLESFWNQDRTEFTTRRCVSRRWLKASFGKDPELADVIDALKPYHPDHVVGADAYDQFASDDTVAMWEGFQAPLGDLPGKHVIQLSRDVVIVDEEWDTLIPVISTRWTEGYRGLSDGTPLGRAIAPFQAWEEEMHRKMDDALAASVPWVIGPAGAKMPSDAAFQFVEEDPDHPGRISVEIPRTVSGDVRAHIDTLHQAALRRAGISEQAAAGDAPPQFKSGVALSRWQGIISTRLSEQHHTFQRLWTQSGRILACRGPKVYKSKPINVRRAIGSDVIAQIRWDEITLPEKSYSLAFETVSALGETTAQQLENLEIIKDMGAIDVPQLLLHLNLPDFRAVTKRLNGPRAYLEFQISQAINHAVVQPPMAMQDPVTAEKQTSDAYQAALAEPVRPPARHLEALRVLWRLFRAKASPAPAPAAPAPGPPATAAGLSTPSPEPGSEPFASPGPLPETPPITASP